MERPRDEEREERRGDERQRLVAREAVVGGCPEAQRQLRRRLHVGRRSLADYSIGLVWWDGTPGGGERASAVWW